MSDDHKHTHIRRPRNLDMIWIEVLYRDPSERKEYLENVNELLDRIGYPVKKAIWWHPAEEMYCLTLNEADEFTFLQDKGFWFNLRYMSYLPKVSHD